MEQLEKAKLPASIMIDCSHDNSRKNHLNQPTVAQSIVRISLSFCMRSRSPMLISFIIV
jgi:phospho-2-dehydro-3-deoxyheptonate aldolase